MSKEFVPEAVGALIVCQDVPGLFLGVKHARAKEISQKLASQISMPTETNKPGEKDEEAIARLWQEEVEIEGLYNPGIHLNTCTLATPRARAVLRNHLFYAPLETKITIIDGEIGEAGWVEFLDVLSTPKGSWRFRSSLYESIDCYQRWLNNPVKYVPGTYTESHHRIPVEVFRLIEMGLSEEEALSQLGLSYQPQAKFLAPIH